MADETKETTGISDIVALLGDSPSVEMIMPLLSATRQLSDMIRNIPNSDAQPIVKEFLLRLREEVAICKGVEGIPRLKANVDEAIAIVRRQLGN